LTSDFAIATCDELWSHGVLLERRIGRGTARHDGGQRLPSIVAADGPVDGALTDACEIQRSAMQPLVAWLGDARVRAVASARAIAGVVTVEATLTIAIRGVSIVTTPEHALSDADMLRGLGRIEAESNYRGGLPVVWHNGSGAILLHEAAGHAAEHDAPHIEWPGWLSVRDEPELAVDDCGAPATASDLLREPPACRRRASFRDVPLTRMTTLVVRQSGAPFTIPDERIDVRLVAGGAYEPLTDSISINVAVADLVEGERVRRLHPFTLRQPRAGVARSLAGAAGEPLRYPGVVCSREGQELVVGSQAPLLVTT
jgi:hypothetical protein